jgi:microcystin-dependent protein
MISNERLQELYKEELQKVIDAGIPLPLKEMPKEVQTMKATSKFGDCQWTGTNKEGKTGIRIRVSEYHLPNGEDAVRQTIAHEIIHAAPGYGLGAMGGESNVQLTTAQMPSHKHELSLDYTENANGDPTGGTDSFGAKPGGTIVGVAPAGGFVMGTRVGTLQIVQTGGNQAHNNMPPYLAVNIWKRTA